MEFPLLSKVILSENYSSIVSEQHKMINMKSFSSVPKSLSFALNGQVVAIGFEENGFVVIDTDSFSELYQISEDKCICQLKYSPDSSLLLVCFNDGEISTYDTASDYRKLHTAKCQTPVCQLDWSSDNNYVQCITIEQELIYCEHFTLSRILFLKNIYYFNIFRGN